MTTTLYSPTFEANMKTFLDAVGKKLGIHLELEGIMKNNGKTARLVVSARTIDADGQVADPEGDNFRRMARHYGLEPDDLGKTFKLRGTLYTIKGLNPGAPSYPILGERVVDGRGFKFPAAAVRAGLGRPAR